jgi:hypothetical protein
MARPARFACLEGVRQECHSGAFAPIKSIVPGWKRKDANSAKFLWGRFGTLGAATKPLSDEATKRAGSPRGWAVWERGTWEGGNGGRRGRQGPRGQGIEGSRTKSERTRCRIDARGSGGKGGVGDWRGLAGFGGGRCFVCFAGGHSSVGPERC